MNLQAIYHRPESNYCFASSQKELTLRLRFAKGEKIEFVSVLYNTKYAIAEKQFESEMELFLSDNLFDYYTVTLALADSRVSYVFKLRVDGKNYFYCEDGLWKITTLIMRISIVFNSHIFTTATLSKMRSGLITPYFIKFFVDRFYKASKKDESYITNDWKDLPTPKSFLGGDLDGIRQKLPYVKSLGVNALLSYAYI